MKTIILCTVSTTDYNDRVVNGFVHFTLKSRLNDVLPIYAVYYSKEEWMEIKTDEEVIDTIRISKEDPRLRGHSVRYYCVNSIGSMLDAGDNLMVNFLSDLGNKEEAKKLYYLFLKKGIHLNFFDASYLDTEMLGLTSEPSPDQKRMINKIIENYFRCAADGYPSLQPNEVSKLSSYQPKEKKDCLR